MLAAHLVAVGAALGLWFLWFEPWYRAIELPSWSPPDGLLRWGWAFGLILAAAAFWQVHDGASDLTGLAIVLLWIQVGLAVSWAALFFRGRRSRTGFYVICMQWTAAALAAAAAAALVPVAGVILLPWLVLIAYVGAFNFFVWQLEQSQ